MEDLYYCLLAAVSNCTYKLLHVSKLPKKKITNNDNKKSIKIYWNDGSYDITQLAAGLEDWSVAVPEEVNDVFLYG